MTAQTIAMIVIAVLQVITGIITALGLRNQKLTDERWQRTQKQVDDHENKLLAWYKEFGACKVDCTQSFVNNEQFVREAGFTRRSLESITGSLARMEGKLEITERLPEIAGQIATNIAREFKKND